MTESCVGLVCLRTDQIRLSNSAFRSLFSTKDSNLVLYHTIRGLDHRPHYRSQCWQQMQLDQMGIVEVSPGHCLPLWYFQTQSQQLYTWSKFLVTASWRNISISGWLENSPLMIVIGESKVIQTGLYHQRAWTSPLSRKRKRCKRQSYVKRCILRALRHKTRPLIIVNLANLFCLTGGNNRH